MTNLIFSFQECLDEITSFTRIADSFIAPDSKFVLPQFREKLESYRDQETATKIIWEIPEVAPLRTVISEGGYEPGSGGFHHLIAEISSAWEIKRIPERRGRTKYFELTGLASSKVKLFCEASGHSELAMWKMEIGDSNSPGCHFHVQILGEHGSCPFPNTLSVPRLPSIMVSPMAVTEYVLAEIFQDRWAEHINYGSPDLDRWIPIQKRRIKQLLEWHIGVIDNGGSPWTSLKKEKPPQTLFQ